MFPDAISTAFPDTRIQLCTVHMLRNSMKYVPLNDYKPVTAELKNIYQSATEDEALLALDQFADRWDENTLSSANHGAHTGTTSTCCLTTRKISEKAIYTTNAIESFNSVIRKAVRKRKLFPTNDSALKVIYLAFREASKKWTVPIRNWKLALNRFMVGFEDRLANYI